LKKILHELAKNYFWFGNNFQIVKVLHEKYFLQRIKELVKNKSKRELVKEVNNFKTKVFRLRQAKKNLFKKHHFSKGLKQHFAILEESAAWIDDRKRFMITTNHYHELFCQEVAKRFKLNVWLVKYYSPEELKILFLKNKKVPDKIIKARRRFSAQVVVRGKGWHFQEKIFYNKEAKAIYDAIFKIAKDKEIKGQVASAPVAKMKGQVQIILDVNKQKFKPGNILVTSMTRPEFVPLLRQAKAIITDEGGLTCHAAIVSRELGIPCVIGTKIATEVLKDGDYIEVNANHGVITILKRK